MLVAGVSYLGRFQRQAMRIVKGSLLAPSQELLILRVSCKALKKAPSFNRNHLSAHLFKPKLDLTWNNLLQTPKCLASFVLIISCFSPTNTEMQSVKGSVNNPAAAVGMHINASETKMLSAVVSMSRAWWRALGGYYNIYVHGLDAHRKQPGHQRSHEQDSDCNPTFACGVNYHWMQRPGSTRQKWIQFRSTRATY